MKQPTDTKPSVLHKEKEIEKELMKIKPTKEEVQKYSEDEWVKYIYPIKAFLAGQNSQKEKDLEMIEEDLKKEKIKKKIKKLEEEHIIYNGFSIDECGYDNCIDRKNRNKLRKKLKYDK